MPRVRFCPHCGKDYPWSHKTCDHCDLPPRTLDHTRREVVEAIHDDVAGDQVGQFEWVSGGPLGDDEGDCELCQARDGQVFARGQLEALMKTKFCLHPYCRCSVATAQE